VEAGAAPGCSLPYPRRSIATVVCLLTAAGFASGCSSIGPQTVPRDRVDYVTGIAESWKEQTLLNIVRMRYGDAPTFVDVSSVISAYALQGQLSASGNFSSNLTSTIPSSIGSVGGAATYLDRPTITYTPLMGERFARSLLQPIPPSAIFELIQAGYPADRILQVTARAINGIYNRSSIGGQTRQADPEFYPLLDALRRLQASGAIALRLEKRGDGEVGRLIISAEATADVEADRRYVQNALHIKAEKNAELTITFGALQKSENEIALLSRSMMEILLELANGIEVPAAHIAEGRTNPSTRIADASDLRDRPLVRIQSSVDEPGGSFAAVRYRDTWYWIGDDDLASKRVVTFLMMFFSLAETGIAPQAPVLTIPAN